MLYINDNVLHIFGCDTPEEFRELTGNTFRGMVYADDFAAIQSSIDEQIADSANEIRSGLLAGISHDIRSPMRTIAEYLRHLKSHVYDPAKLRGDLENMGAAAQRMERLVDNLLDMSTAEFGRADIHPEPCRLSEQVRYATGLFRARAGSKSQTLTESIDLPEEEVLADVQRLRTVRFVGGVTRDEKNRPDFLGFTMRNDGLSDVSDPVTGLPSRHRFFRELQQGVDGAPVRSALIIRVGRLNRINEEYGYGRGNETMRQVGHCIREEVGDNGVVYRLMGAEFAVLSPTLDENGMMVLYAAIRERLHRSVEVDGVSHRLIAFGGLLLRSEVPELNEKEVYDYLKTACADSEQRRQGALVIYHEAGVKEPVECQITREIRRCMSREYENFFLRYQPVYAVKSAADFDAARHLAELSRAYGADVYFKAVESEEMANALAAPDLRGVQGRYYAGSVFYDEVLDLIENAQ